MLNTLTVQEVIEALKRCDPHKSCVINDLAPIDDIREVHLSSHSVVQIRCRPPLYTFVPDEPKAA